MLTLKFDAVCRQCGADIPAGSTGQYDRDVPDPRRRWRCVACFQGSTEPARGERFRAATAQAAAVSTARAVSRVADVFGAPQLAQRACCPGCGLAFAVVLVVDTMPATTWVERVTGEQQAASRAAETAAVAAVAAATDARTSEEHAERAAGAARAAVSESAHRAARAEQSATTAADLAGAAEAAATAATLAAERAAAHMAPNPAPAPEKRRNRRRIVTVDDGA